MRRRRRRRRRVHRPTRFWDGTAWLMILARCTLTGNNTKTQTVCYHRIASKRTIWQQHGLAVLEGSSLASLQQSTAKRVGISNRIMQMFKPDNLPTRWDSWNSRWVACRCRRTGDFPFLGAMLCAALFTWRFC